MRANALKNSRNVMPRVALHVSFHFGLPCVAKCDEVRRVNAETRVLAPAMTNDRLKQFALVQSAHDCRDHVHELKVLSFHIAGEQALGVWSKFKKAAVKS